MERYTVQYTVMQKAILTTSASAEMTFPNVVRDLFMFAPSWNRKYY